MKTITDNRQSVSEDGSGTNFLTASSSTHTLERMIGYIHISALFGVEFCSFFRFFDVLVSAFVD